MRPQPRHTPLTGIEPGTLQSRGRRSIHRAKPVRLVRPFKEWVPRTQLRPVALPWRPSPAHRGASTCAQAQDKAAATQWNCRARSGGCASRRGGSRAPAAALSAPLRCHSATRPASGPAGTKNEAEGPAAAPAGDVSPCGVLDRLERGPRARPPRQPAGGCGIPEPAPEPSAPPRSRSCTPSPRRFPGGICPGRPAPAGGTTARSLLQDWCRGLDVDVHRALLVTGIPEGLEPAAIEAALQPAFLPLGTFRLRSTRVVRGERAKAALVELLEDLDPSAIPGEVPGGDGAWTVLCTDRAEDTRVLRRMKRSLRDERAPGAAPSAPAAQTQAQGSERAAQEDGPPLGAASKARKGRRSRRSRARSHRLTQKGKKRGRGGRSFPGARRGSEDSSSDCPSVVIEELDQGALGGPDAQRALYSTLQVAARELVRKWAPQGDPEDARGPREFLALVTVTDKAKKEELERETPGAESISLNIEDLSGVPDLVALLAVRDTWFEEEPVDGDASDSGSQASGDPEPEGRHPEFVAIVAYTDPADPSARGEMLKIASVIESLGWSARKERRGALPEVLAAVSPDACGARVQVREAGRQVDALVLREARDDGDLLERVSALAQPEARPPGRPAPRGPLAGRGAEGEGEAGLLELVALLAAQDVAERMEEESEGAWAGGKCGHRRGRLGELLGLLAARENGGSEEESEGTAEDTEREESEPEDRASKKPRAKRARTASKVLGPASAPSRSRETRRGARGRGDRGNTLEKKAREEAAGDKKNQKGRAGPRAKAGEARGQPPAGSKSTRGKEARRGGRLAPKCC